MLRETIHDLRSVAREMPWFAAAVVLSVAVSIGVNASVLDEAEEEHIRLSARRADVPMTTTIEEVKSRLLHRCPTEKISGFTVIVALRQYSLELSVPMGRVRSQTDDAWTRLKGSLNTVELRRAA